MKNYLKVKNFYFSYLVFFLKYFSFKKFFNFVLNTIEFRTKRIYLASVPPIVHMDVSNLCVLHCPLCATGKGDKSQTKGTMSFSDFKVNFDKVKDYLFFVWLYNWGEPFLCKDIFKIIDYCHKNNVGVKLDSNLNYYSENILEDIVKSKIDYISLSIDGATQDTYQFYRRGGNLKKVTEGIEQIVALKKKYKSEYPFLVWQFLINNQNFEEVEKAKNLSNSLGVDIFEARPLTLFLEVDSKFSKDNYLRYMSKVGIDEKSASSRKSIGACRYLWQSLAINPDSTYCACPIVYKKDDVFGKIHSRDNIKNIINGKKYVESRKLFKLKNYHLSDKTPCDRCEWFTKC